MKIARLVTVAAARLVASVGVGMVVSNAVKATTPANLKRYQKIGVAVGSFVIGNMVVDRAGIYVASEINTLYNGFRSPIEVAREEGVASAIKITMEGIPND